MLHVRAKERLQSGELPINGPSKRFTGYGSGVCALCDARIQPSEIQYELEFVNPRVLGRTVIHFHSQCESIWNDERLRLQVPA